MVSVSASSFCIQFIPVKSRLFSLLLPVALSLFLSLFLYIRFPPSLFLSGQSNEHWLAYVGEEHFMNSKNGLI